MRRLHRSAAHIACGQGQGRTADLPLFRRRACAPHCTLVEPTLSEARADRGRSLPPSAFGPRRAPIQSDTVKSLNVTAWTVVRDGSVEPENRHLVHAGDRCYLPGCNRPFMAREHVAYTDELSGRQPICASHVDEERPNWRFAADASHPKM